MKNNRESRQFPVNVELIKKAKDIFQINNIGEPLELNIYVDNEYVAVPSILLGLSIVGMSLMIIDKEFQHTIAINAKFKLLFSFLSKRNEYVLSGIVSNIRSSKMAQTNHILGEWLIDLKFESVPVGYVEVIKKMADAWYICEEKIALNVSEICFRKCPCWQICEKSIKLHE